MRKARIYANPPPPPYQEQIARHEKNRAHEYNFVMLLDRLRSFIPVDEGNKCVTKNNAKIQPQEKSSTQMSNKHAPGPLG